MSSTSVVDQICQYFGGAYQEQMRYYGTPTVPGLGAVRRAWAKSADKAQWYLGMPEGTENGSVMRVRISTGAEVRVAMAGQYSGGKKVAHNVELLVEAQSTGRSAEDIEDYTRQLLDDIRERIHADRTCGSMGFENGGFQVGEDYDGPGSPVIDWEFSDVVTSAGLSKQSLTITFSASEYIEA